MKVAIVKCLRQGGMSIEELRLDQFGHIKHRKNGFTEVYDEFNELSIVVRTEDVQSIVIGVVAE